MRRVMVLLLGFSTLATASLAGVGDVQRSPNETGPSSAGAFNRWVLTYAGDDSGWKAKEYAAFQGMLEDEGVAGIVPTWQLWRVDAQYASRCGTEYFAMPPKERWRDVVPALRLLRDEVIPMTGPLEVVSGWRSPAINICVNGASRSRHLEFKALDLVATTRSDKRKLFKDLCAMQRAAGTKSALGLGAYFDPSDIARNTEGRFHIDASGYRTWGYDYTAKTNPCPKLG
jgi:Peptidase M15